MMERPIVYKIFRLWLLWLYIYLFTEACLEHSGVFPWGVCEIFYFYKMRNFLFSQKLCLGCLTEFCMCLKFIYFILFINYSLIALSIYSFASFIINLCVWFKSVYIGHFLLFSCVSMSYHFCLRNLYMKIFIRGFFNLLTRL